jgi:hypothetical protein
MTPKPAYHQLKALIKGKWWTNTEASISQNGKTTFRGFLGRYKATAKADGKTLTAHFTLDKAQKLPIEVRLT